MSGKRGKNDAADAATICEATTVHRQAHQHLEDSPGWCNTVVGDMLSELAHLDERIKEYDQHIEQAAKEALCKSAQTPGWAVAISSICRARPGLPVSCPGKCSLSIFLVREPPEFDSSRTQVLDLIEFAFQSADYKCGF